MIPVLFVTGSRRRESFNSRLLAYLMEILAGRCTPDVLDPAQVDLPLFDQDLEADASAIAKAAAIHRRFASCQALVVATPEYNGQPTAYLKNLVDWVSRLSHVDSRFGNPFRNKALLLCSASTGWSGGSIAMPHARALFAYVGCLVMPDSVNVPYADQAWTGSGFAFDPDFDAQAYAGAERFLRLAEACSDLASRKEPA